MPASMLKTLPRTSIGASSTELVQLPVLAKSCLGCHNDKALAGKLSLEPLRDPATTATHTAIWQSVLAMPAMTIVTVIAISSSISEKPR